MELEPLFTPSVREYTAAFTDGMSTTQTLAATPTDNDTTMKIGGRTPQGSGRLVPYTFSGSEDIDISIMPTVFVWELELQSPRAGRAYYYKITVTKET